jgi:hypothetical protein
MNTTKIVLRFVSLVQSSLQVSLKICYKIFVKTCSAKNISKKLQICKRRKLHIFVITNICTHLVPFGGIGTRNRKKMISGPWFWSVSQRDLERRFEDLFFLFGLEVLFFSVEDTR